MCIGGTWRYIILDDFIPCKENGPGDYSPAFAKPRVTGNVNFFHSFHLFFFTGVECRDLGLVVGKSLC